MFLNNKKKHLATKFEKSGCLFAFLFGALSSFLWLASSFAHLEILLEVFFGVNPSFLRILRTIAPISVWLLASDFRLGMIPPKVLTLAILTFGIWPLVIGISVWDSGYVLNVCMPQVATLLFLFGVAKIRASRFRAFVLGFSFISTVALICSVCFFGFESTTYSYGNLDRNRFLLGFKHPVPAASALIASMVFIVMFFKRIIFLKLRLAQSVITLGIIVSFLLSLKYVGSRNLVLSVCIGLFFVWLLKNVKLHHTRTCFKVLCSAIVSLYLAPYFLIHLNLADFFGVGGSALYRLVDYGKVLNAFDQRPIIEMFLPSESPLGVNNILVGGPTFAVTDSVYLSFLHHFGFIGLFFLLYFFLFVGNKLLKNRLNEIAVGTLITSLVFFCFDAQGLTTGNLVCLGLWSFSFREFLRSEARLNLKQRLDLDPLVGGA